MTYSNGRISALCKQSAVSATAILGGAGFISASHADILTFETRELELVVSEGESKVFDLNDDGRMDFSLSVDKGRFASIRGLSGFDLEGGEFGAGQNSLVFVENKAVSPEGKFVQVFASGGEVAKPKPGFKLTSKGILYDDKLPTGSEGPFEDDGTSGFLGLAVGPLINNEDDFEIRALDIETADTEEEEPKRAIGFNYGWIEVMRGSINTFRIGFQTAVGAAAPIPRDPVDVPEPASLPLMALGAAGLLAMRRKMAA